MVDYWNSWTHLPIRYQWYTNLSQYDTLTSANIGIWLDNYWEVYQDTYQQWKIIGIPEHIYQ